MKDKVVGDHMTLGKSIMIGANSKITGRTIIIEDNVVIGNDVTISADYIFIGYGSKIDDRCTIKLPGLESRFVICDNCRIGSDQNIIIPIFETGDYVTIHNHCLVNGHKPCRIGHNTWVGQNCILNVNEEIRIGNNVGAGIYSSIWTHGFFGELLEGCNVFKVAPVTIEDDVWILGAYNVIFPGVTLGRKSIIMTGSVVTKDVPAGHCVSGNPAIDITHKINPYKELSIEEKFEKMKEFTREFAENCNPHGHKNVGDSWSIRNEGKLCKILFVDELKNNDVGEDKTSLVVTKSNQTTKDFRNVTIFDLSTKLYTKKRTKLEIDYMRFLVSYRARFLPEPSRERINKPNA